MAAQAEWHASRRQPGSCQPTCTLREVSAAIASLQKELRHLQEKDRGRPLAARAMTAKATEVKRQR
eukprot:1157853-Pelagomonas_calceolata.AAC.10